MSITVLLELQVKPDQVDTLKQMFEEALPDTRGFDGCIKLDILVNQDQPANMVLVQTWQTRAHQARYSSWRQETGFIAKMGALLAAPPSVRYYDLLDL